MLCAPIGRRYRVRVSSARDLLAALLLTGALLLGALWLPGAWIDRNVVEQSGFLAITEPLAADEAIQRDISDSAVEKVLDDDRIPGWVADQLAPLIQDQAPKLTGTQGYATLWDGTMRDLHEGLFTSGASDLEVDLSPVIEQMLDAVDGSLPVKIPRPENATITLTTIPDVPVLTTAQTVAPWFSWAGPAALVLAALALLVAAHRRAMLALAGVAGIIAGALTCLLAGTIGTLVPNSIDQADFLGPIVQAFETQFAADVMPQGVIILGVGALIATVGLVLVGVHRRD